jgi:hypothetical protein
MAMKKKEMGSDRGAKAKAAAAKKKAELKSSVSKRTDKYGRTSFGVDAKGRSQGDNYVRGDMGANYMGRKSVSQLKKEKEAKVVRSNKAQSGRLTAQADKKKSQAKVNEMARYQKVQRDAVKIFKKAREREAARKSETARKAKQKER